MGLNPNREPCSTAQRACRPPLPPPPQDRAALIAALDPATVARLLAEMDPREAVLLLSALGDAGRELVGEALPAKERAKLIKVGDCAAGRAARLAGLSGGACLSVGGCRVQGCRG